jgi:hypothetical protein
MRVNKNSMDITDFAPTLPVALPEQTFGDFMTWPQPFEMLVSCVTLHAPVYVAEYLEASDNLLDLPWDCESCAFEIGE